MNIVRFYNQNRRKIWRAILIIASFIILIRLLNYLSIRSTNDKDNKFQVSNEQSKMNEVSSNSTATSNTSGVNGGKISDNDIRSTQDVLDRFFGYCNKQDLNNAYAMLTDECKSLIYPNISLFKSNYYDNIFGGHIKMYSFENWNGNIYKVTIEDDILSTGRVSSDADKKIDYVTIIDNKLNISTYIKSKEINKQSNSNGISVLVKSKNVFMDYEEYHILVKNNTSNTILLGNIRDSRSIVLQDSNKVKYGVYNTELVERLLQVDPGLTTELKLKFFSSYVTSKEIDCLIFEKVNMNFIRNSNNEGTFETIYAKIEE